MPAFLALAQRAFIRIEMLLLPASLIWPRLRGPAAAEDDEARRVRPPVRASMAATTRSRCSVSASIIEGVSMALNYKATRHVRTSLQARRTQGHEVRTGRFCSEQKAKNAEGKSQELATSSQKPIATLTACRPLFLQCRVKQLCSVSRQETLWVVRSAVRRNSLAPGPV